MVIATTAATFDMQGILDALWRHLLPAVGARTPDPEADRRLADRLAAATLPALSAASDPADRRVWDGATFLPGDGPQIEASPIGDLGIAFSEAGLRVVDDSWRLSLTDAGGRIEMPVGHDAWTVDESSGVPVAVSGGWAEPDTFVADVIFLDTPHSVRITCRGPDRTLVPLWRTVALHPKSVLHLRKP